ncbi:MAG: hypothetical protein DA330_01030 [Nitrososphaera sp.]|nr:hypothetical protein [Nitrososphaera sp.]
MSDLERLFNAQAVSARWMAEHENTGARLEIALIKERAAYLLSQHEPVASLGLDREALRAALSYLWHGSEQQALCDFFKGKKL